MHYGIKTDLLPLHQSESLLNHWKIAIYILLILCVMYILFLVTCFLFCVCIIPTASLTCSMFLVLLQFVDILLFHVSGLSAVCRYFYCFMFQVLWFFLMLWFWFRVSCHLNFPLFCIALWECYLDKRQNIVLDHCNPSKQTNFENVIFFPWYQGLGLDFFKISWEQWA